jgi:hypothetical protein
MEISSMTQPVVIRRVPGAPPTILALCAGGNTFHIRKAVNKRNHFHG